MDSIIGSYSGMVDEDLFLADTGIAYQIDRSHPYEYGEEYFTNYIDREGSQIARKLNKYRTGVSSKYCSCVLDMGIGSGEFIKSSKIKVYGYDVNPHGIAWLKDRDLYVDPYEGIPTDVGGISLWDTMEHIEEPTKFLNLLPAGMFVFISLPTFDNISKIRESKHYKPREHLYYFSKMGLCTYMDDMGFVLLDVSDAEIKAGREGIESFVFKKGRLS